MILGQLRMGARQAKNAPLAVVYFFQAGVLLSKENAKIWLLMANFGYFVANLNTLCRTFYRPK